MFFIVNTSAIAEEEKAAELYQECGEFLKSDEDSSKDTVAANACHNYLGGMLAVGTYYQLFHKVNKGFCLPKSTTKRELATAIIDYIDQNHPLNIKLMKRAIAVRALEKSFPCSGE
ncbi:Rap1a/Tai family immunity protein [Planctobacterium marinum]|uniref:Rap1a/Tai family immunity protein n=1 Tax=Planctobacterium marinum TaxID=1631968 RepID=UPI0030C74402